MNNSLMFFDRFSIFIFLIVSFQYFHSVSLNSFKLEFLVQVIPYFLLIDLFIFPRKIIKLFQNKFLSFSLFISFCFLSLLWTGNIKYTLASNLELLLTYITIIIVVSYIERNKYGLENYCRDNNCSICLFFNIFGYFIYRY